jgi:transposase
MKIRVVKTASGAQAVQVVSYENTKRRVIKHFGSSHTDEEREELLALAKEWIKQVQGQLNLFSADDPSKLIHLNHCTFLGVQYSFLYELLGFIHNEIGFSKLEQPFLCDLVTIRLVEPASKLRSIELLEQYFGLSHQRKTYYKLAPNWLHLKQEAEKLVVDFAKKTYSFTYNLLFYDVTTLYFETFDQDELRANGFSKDNKSAQPQILIGLMVSQLGFPISYEIFAGNTFEGHTMIPVVKQFMDKYSVNSLTVVADAAMISAANMDELKKHDIHYIVGARLGNVSAELIAEIDRTLLREDGKTIRIQTSLGDLICSFSLKRYRKDSYEMQKQLDKAAQLLSQPSRKKKLKFTKSKGEQLELNQALIDKTKKLLGIKGYYTNLEENKASNQTIIERYHELYKIEQAFRISKNDLQTRPIFHFKEEPIKLHILVCFMALVIAKHMELATGNSINRIITECKKITDARLFNQLTNTEIRLRTKLTPKMIEYLEKLNAPH